MTLFVDNNVSLIFRGIQLFIYILMGINIIVTNNLSKLILVVGSIVLLIAGTYIVYPYNRPALMELSSSMVLQGFYFIIGYSIDDEKKAVDTLKWGSFIALGYMIYGIFIRGGESLNNYDIVSSGLYWIVLVFLLISKKKIKYKYILFGISFLLMLIYGRSSHIIYVGLIIVILLFRSWAQSKIKKRLIYLFVIIVLIVCVALSYRTVLDIVINIMDSCAINSRTLVMIKYGEFSDLNGRRELFGLAWQMITEKPFCGHGIGSTMVRWASTHPNMSNYAGCNTHNSILEIGAEFGVIGMILFVFTNCFLIKNIITWELNENQLILIMLLVGTGLISVMVGSSYLNITQYALFIGYYIKLKKKNKLQKRFKRYYTIKERNPANGE